MSMLVVVLYTEDKFPFSVNRAKVRLGVCVYCFNKFIHLNGPAEMRLAAAGNGTSRLLQSCDMKVIMFPPAATGFLVWFFLL